MASEASSAAKRRPETRSSASKVRSSATKVVGDGERRSEASACSVARLSSLRKRSREVEVFEVENEAEEEPAGRGRERAQQARMGTREERDLLRFVGPPFGRKEARERWPHRYQEDAPLADRDVGEAKAKCHYRKAIVDRCTYELYDDVYMKAGEGVPHYIGRIVELFESKDNELYFTCQWFFRATDTILKEHGDVLHERRMFLSDKKNDNLLGCIVSKAKVVQVAPNVDQKTKKRNIPSSGYYYDMKYDPSYATFANVPASAATSSSDGSSSTLSSEENSVNSRNHKWAPCSPCDTSKKAAASLLDLYSGCGAMSTGLCLGAELAGLRVESRWAVDFNEYACESVKRNHPNVEVRNEKAEDFLALLREWEKLCQKYSVIGGDNSSLEDRDSSVEDQDTDDDDDDDATEEDSSVSPDEYEVVSIVGICYGDPGNTGKFGLKFKVRWKGYTPSEDTWEPIESLRNCPDRIKDFVNRGYKSKILPLPGHVDVICGGPPCQGISGFNRFRNFSAPLDDPKNLQMQIFMDIVEHLKPRFVLMENVVDILKFAGGYLGRYAMARLVSMNYQARLGMMAAGCYGLPQFRMRAFLWGALPSESLPRFPLPTHNVIVRGSVPTEFESCVVAYDESQPCHLEDALVLKDAIADLPPVENDEERDEMPYKRPPRTVFQKLIRAAMPGKVYDHRPLKLNEDDYERVRMIPKKKGANFRNLPGVRVREDNSVEWDHDVARVYLPSGKPLVPDYAMNFVGGKSCRPFGRLWWDETVPTVVTRAEPHNQAILHPEQNRVLTIRENARLQGFPDHYKLCGPVKERYTQVGNAVAVPVARALGYALGLAFLGIDCGDKESLLQLPGKFQRLDAV
ncbi:DNA (cytosine-5)-methyltransferase CMT3-like isoform X2 [Wolffia australiana]